MRGCSQLPDLYCHFTTRFKRSTTMNSKKRLLRVLFPALFISTLGFAQSLPSMPAPPDVATPAPAWGTSVESALVIGSFQFQAYSAGTTKDTVFRRHGRFS